MKASRLRPTVSRTMPPAPAPLFSRTPPAIFPVLFGLLGLGLAWRRAAEALGVPAAVGELVLGAVTLLWTFAALAYLAKVARRPGVLLDELRILPGRAGVAAITQGAMLVAAALVPHAPGLAGVVLGGAVACHALIAVLSAWAIATGPAEQRHVTPAWHLTFVGFILAPIAALPLGLVALAQLCTVFAAIMAGIVYAVSIAQLARQSPPAPLRPLLAIHLAPLALFGMTAAGFGKPMIAFAFGILATLVLAALLARIRFLTEAGFSPFWGAFTFPLAGFASLLLTLATLPVPGAPLFGTIGALALIGATVVIPPIAAKVLQMWATGILAARTNAAQA
ncbi:tellurite resistance protein [Meinhardsimonia xiamenensis]|jgi:tellurite resistance protein|uniref:Tellurite resistance protein n=1 Tax=Meinhardsimonia xiamenensis TaxID=990712 RepID=A0A1G9D7L3_9RHOB|nr:tellurium resistance protein [Meinhardsimonia xiamenensis]PRX38100.1 tellurite resistance protein [Meinhardsimonia xiamenensis]SDK59897.1 tellurite resistance protein [Meinhardsimonia xiamenensis]